MQICLLQQGKDNSSKRIPILAILLIQTNLVDQAKHAISINDSKALEIKKQLQLNNNNNNVQKLTTCLSVGFLLLSKPTDGISSAW